MVGAERVAGFFISVANPEHDLYEGKKITPSEKKYLDSTLIFSSIDLYARYEAIRTAPPLEGYYNRLRDLALIENNQQAVVALARYKKEQDTGLILNNKDDESLMYTYQAMSEFPHPIFLPFLRTFAITF